MPVAPSHPGQPPNASGNSGAAVNPAPASPGAPRRDAGAARWRAAPARPPDRQARRVAIALAVLIVTSFLLLNILIYQGVQSGLVRDRWGELTASADAKRADVRALLERLDREAEFVTAQGEIPGWFQQTPDAAPPPERAPAFVRTLDEAVTAFGWRAIEFVSPDGVVLIQSSEADRWRAGCGTALAQEASLTGRRRLAIDLGQPGREPCLVVAYPVRASDQTPLGVTAVLTLGIDDRFRAVLAQWTAPGRRSGVYLVALAGREAAILSAPPVGSGLSIGERLPLTAPLAKAASMAAQGVETTVEIPDAPGGPLWAVSRALPEIGCGIVAQAERAPLLSGMRSAVFGLLALDLGALVLMAFAAWQWRRQLQLQAAQHDAMVTRRQAERLQSILDNVFETILSIDADGRVVTANRAAERLFASRAGDMEGQPLERFLHWRETSGSGVGEAPALGTVSRSEAHRPDGSSIPVEFSLTRSSEDGGLRYTVVARDISERLEAEQKIQEVAEGLEVSNRRLEEANVQLEQASRLKSEFLANTSHELRTPLNGIMGFLQLVLDGMCDTKEEERDFLNQALQCSRHLLGLINDVLDIAKIEAGKLSLQVEPVDVRALFDEVYTVTHVQARQKGIELTFEPPAGGVALARGDLGKVKQILVNLVGNSLKFTPSGSITVRAKEQTNVGHFLFEVVDTGIGIAPERQGVIFEKFTQGDGSPTRRYGGTGLGLAIARNLVELMGGIIGVESKGEGFGTRMYFSLPVWRGPEAEVADAERAEAAAHDLIGGPPGGALVLVVEDDPVFRKFATVLLQQYGYRTVEAASAETGWMLSRRLRPSIIVLDYALSCADGAVLRSGWDLAQRLGNDARTRSIPLVFLTGFEGQVRERLRSGLLTHAPQTLRKPVDPQALIAKVEQVLGEAPDHLIRILVADDDPAVSAYLGKVLPLDRFHLEVVNDGEQCLHLLRTQPRAFDLLLLDLMMPGVSGYDVLREMTLKGTAAGLPVIVLTNSPGARNAEEQQLLDQGLVLEVVAKTAVHENPKLLPHIIDNRLEPTGRTQAAAPEAPIQIEHFRAQPPEGEGADATPADLGIERLVGEGHRPESLRVTPPGEGELAPNVERRDEGRKEAA